MLRARVLPAFALLGTIACGTSPAIREAPPKAPAPAPASASESGRGATEWTLAYTRHCEGRPTPPIVSPSGQVAFCDARFDVEHGHFRGLVDHGLGAFVDDAHAVFAGFRGGLRLARVVRGVAPSTIATSPGGFVHAIAISPSRAQAVSLETDGASAAAELVVRELPSLEVVRRTGGVLAEAPTFVGWLADGREVVFGRRERCAEPCGPALLVRAEGSLVPLTPAIAEANEPASRPPTGASASASAIGARGDRAVVAGSDGVRVVSLPSGETLLQIAEALGGLCEQVLTGDHRGACGLSVVCEGR